MLHMSADATRARYDRATAHLDPPHAIVDLPAFDANADSLARHASGKLIRVASKSVRCRTLLRRVLARPGWRGVLAYTLAEANWLVAGGTTDDAVVAYPTADRTALARLAADPRLAESITLMIDSTEHLDLVDSVVPPGHRPALRVCLDLDASWRPAPGVHVGVRRSPLHRPDAVGRLAAQVAARAGFRLIGLMGYEAQLAGVGDAPPGRRLRALAIRAMQKRSYVELLARRAAAVSAALDHADLEFVNGGGTGSITTTPADPAVTEVTAGSGLYGPALFDTYRGWRPVPAALFALPVVRRPGPELVTVAGGGWIASGPAGRDRLPAPWLPAGLRLLGAEGAGEVQTPLRGPAADGLRLGDRVWFRHAKAGEVCEHVNTLHLVQGEAPAEPVPTYRGESQAFL
jgi:D-serine deaminase-like pyridoxal phosphate-dependent protein